MYTLDLIPKSNKTNKGVFPLPFRCLVVGTSGCGKITLLYNLILKKWGIPFHYLYIFFKNFRTRCISKIKKGL